MSNHTYWFVVYEWDHIPGGQHKPELGRHANTVIKDEHPVDHNRRMNEECGENAWMERGSPTRGPDASYEEHRLHWFIEIDEEVYERNVDSLT